jgi:hypothetical protein
MVRRGRFTKPVSPSILCKYLCLFVAIIIIIVILVGTFLIFSILQPACSRDSDCSDTCVKGICDHGKCSKEEIPGCCRKDSDCTITGCSKEYCDVNTLTCQLLPPSNGTLCNDYDPCTKNDVCLNYICKGTPEHCPSSVCATSQCYDGQCVLHPVQNGVTCNSNNKCYGNGSCQNGVCTSKSKDCSYLDSVCTKGECVPDTGDCISVAINNGGSCNDGFQCTTQDTCKNGHCSGVENPCYDNNPCTFNKCVEGYGCMLKYDDSEGNVCSATCMDKTDCPQTGENWVCADGTCVTLAYNGSQIRFIDYEIEECGNGHRLVMDFILDTEFLHVNTETWYLIPRSFEDIDEGTTDLGFIDQKRALESMVMTDYVRTGFTLTTGCQNVTNINCDQIFSNKRYQFHVELHHCEQITGPCQDTNIMISSSIALSISDCTNFPKKQSIDIYGIGVIYVYNEKHTGIVEDPAISTGDFHFTVGYESPLLGNPNFKTIATDVRVCRANVDHYMHQCVSGKDSSCTMTGCYNWDPSDSPIAEYHDIMKNSVITAVAKADWIINTCHPEDKYNVQYPCQLGHCPTDWVAPMDDGFKLKSRPLESYEKHLWTFDIRFKVHLCNNLLASSNNEYHNIVTLLI